MPQFADALAKRHYPLPWEELVGMTRQLLLDLREAPPLDNARLKKLSQRIVIGLGEHDGKPGGKQGSRSDHPEGGTESFPCGAPFY